MSEEDSIPLKQFREINQLMMTTLWTLTPERQQQLKRKQRQFDRELQQLFRQLSGYSITRHQYDDDGSTVMLSPEEASRIAAQRQAAAAAAGKHPYAVYASTDKPPTMYQRLTELTRQIAEDKATGLLFQQQTVLDSDRPIYEPRKLMDDGQTLSKLMYLRNLAWMRMFAGEANSVEGTLRVMNDQMRGLWRAYSDEHVRNAEPLLVISGSDDDAEAEQLNTINALDALFRPIRVIDYSPEELAVAIQVRRVISYYHELLVETIRDTKASLKQEIQRAKVAENRVTQLQQELVELRAKRDELKAQIQRVAAEARERLHRQLAQIDLQEADAARLLRTTTQSRLTNSRGELGGSKKHGRAANAAYTRLDQFLSFHSYLMHTYLDRETRFLAYLADVLRRRRDHKRLHRMLEPEYRDISSIERDRGTSLATIKEYLRERDRLLERLYMLAEPVHAKEGQPPPQPTPPLQHAMLAVPTVSPLKEAATKRSRNDATQRSSYPVRAPPL